MLLWLGVNAKVVLNKEGEGTPIWEISPRLYAIRYWLKEHCFLQRAPNLHKTIVTFIWKDPFHQPGTKFYLIKGEKEKGVLLFFPFEPSIYMCEV